MKAFSICAIALMTTAVIFADKKNDSKFATGPASTYSTKQTNDKVTVAAVPYDSEELAHTAFGKLNPYQHGILPVLIIIQNDTDQALKLDHLTVEYTSVDNRHVDAIPPADVQTFGGAPRPAMPNGSPIPHRKYKNPLNVEEIEGRSFAARMLPAHESASGFFYFQAVHRPGAKFYLTGIKEAATGKDIFFFDVPLDKK